MDSSDEVVEIPIEAAQEYITAALGIAPLHISDLIYNIFTDNLHELIETVVDKIHAKYESHLTQDKIDALKKMMKIKLQGQQNVLFDQFDNFIISEVFNIYDNAVLPDDMVQTTYSKKKHEWIKKSIEKHEKSLLLLNLVEKRINVELANFKILHDDIESASTKVKQVIAAEFGGIDVERFLKLVQTLSTSKDRISKKVKDLHDAIGAPCNVCL